MTSAPDIAQRQLTVTCTGMEWFSLLAILADPEVMQRAAIVLSPTGMDAITRAAGAISVAFKPHLPPRVKRGATIIPFTREV